MALTENETERMANEMRRLYRNPTYRAAYDKARCEGYTVRESFKIACAARRKVVNRKLDVHWRDPKFRRRHAWTTRARKAHWARERGETLTATELLYLEWLAMDRRAKGLSAHLIDEARDTADAWLLKQPGIFF